MTTVNIVPLSTNNPIDLYATDVFKGVLLEWTDFEDTASTLIYRAETNNRANAVVITDCIANSYIDSNVSYNNEYFYWIKFKNIYGREDGEFYPANALTGVSVINNQVLTVDIADNAITDFVVVKDYSTREDGEYVLESNEWHFSNMLQVLQFETDASPKYITVLFGLNDYELNTTTPSSGYYEFYFEGGIFRPALTALTANLTHAYYNNAPGRPAFYGGNGHVIGDIITLNCGANVRIDGVKDTGNANAFTIITSSNVSGLYHSPTEREQVSTTGNGTDFKLFGIGWGSMETLGGFTDTDDVEDDYEYVTAWKLSPSVNAAQENAQVLHMSVTFPQLNTKYNVYISEHIDKGQGTSGGGMTASVYETYIQAQVFKR